MKEEMFVMLLMNAMLLLELSRANNKIINVEIRPQNSSHKDNLGITSELIYQWIWVGWGDVLAPLNAGEQPRIL